MRNELEENQAKKLQQLFAEITNDQNQSGEQLKEVKTEDLIEIDVLNLPPRSEVHLSPRRKLSLSFKKPFVRLIFVLFILLAIICVIYFVVGEQIIIFFT